MGSRVSHRFQPLCPTHGKVMVPTANTVQTLLSDKSDPTEVDHWQCTENACLQNYSPGFGYFTIQHNDDYWIGRRTPSLQITRSSTQVICGEHEDSMFLESFDAQTSALNFHCPRRGCHQTMSLSPNANPAYWCGEGFFKKR